MELATERGWRVKLLLCLECDDLFRLFTGPTRLCRCRKSGGRYLDHEMAEYHGPCVPIGLSNNSLVKAIQNRPESGLGESFKAFVIPEQSRTITHRESAA